MTKQKQKLSLEEKKLRQKEQHILKTYGLSLEDYNKMRYKQNHRCYICNVSEEQTLLCIDHIHQLGFKKMVTEDKKKYVRGLLCYLCNTAIGKLERTKSGSQNRNRLEGINRYFREFKLKGEV